LYHLPSYKCNEGPDMYVARVLGLGRSGAHIVDAPQRAVLICSYLNVLGDTFGGRQYRGAPEVRSFDGARLAAIGPNVADPDLVHHFSSSRCTDSSSSGNGRHFSEAPRTEFKSPDVVSSVPNRHE
jgi:hypothetical protein